MILLEPVLMGPLSLYVMARRLLSELWRRRTAETRLAAWRTRRSEVLATAGAAGQRTDSLVPTDHLDRLRASEGSDEEVVLGAIDQDGMVSPRTCLQDVPTVPADQFNPRLRFDLTLVDRQGVLGVRKRYRGDSNAFLAELAAAHDLRRAGCRVPAILDVDFEGLSITFEYLAGPVLREELARHGAVVRDHDVAAHPSYRHLSERKRRDKRIEEGRAVLGLVLDREGVERLFAELRKIHAAGYVLHDLKFGNVILERSSGQPCFIDFDRARAYPELGRLAFRFLRDRDYEKFNLHFGTDKLTHRRARALTRAPDPRLERLYAPFYVEGGIRRGGIWRTDTGYGRWRYILRDHLPPLEGARVLDLGANNGFNALQMMRQGAREVVAIEIDTEAIAQGELLRELFEWADNRPYPLSYVHESMARLAHIDLGEFDLVTALCSIYYLEDDEVVSVIRHASTITGTMVLQCNTDRRIQRSDPRTYERSSVDYALASLESNGFPHTRVVAPPGYSRPLVIGRRF